MRKSWFGMIAVMACMVLLVASTAALAADKAGELPKLNIKVNGLYPQTSILHKYITEDLAKLIEEAVPRAKTTVYAGNALVPFGKSLEAVQNGLCDFSVVVSGMTPGAHPAHEAIELPFLWPNQAASNALLQELYRRYPYFLKDFGPEVVHLDGDVTLGINLHTSDKPIRKLEDLKGLVLGTMTKSEAQALNLVGASAMLVTPQDIYTQLERGTFKGISTAWGNIQSWRIYEITKYHTITGMTRTSMHALFNKKTWDKLTPDEQKNLTYAFKGALAQSHNVSGSLSTMDVVDNYVMKEKGKHEIITMSVEDIAKWKELVRPMWDEWAANMEKKGYPGKETIKFIERFGQALQEEK